MKPGDIYNVDFPFKPPFPPDGNNSKKRPALIIAISPDGTALALMVKITGSAPTLKYPNRIEIVHWSQANLDKESYAEIDTEEQFDLKEANTYRGTLNPLDFNNILSEYIKLKSRTRHTRRPAR
ncbi:type II toxin-antitoxin system PemK/MazF family toxin [Cytobacillus firmus]|uniref:type II toxin-antitoxin system PemK/MazF family toxin n=1 Tax=Cytobacillus firmus TaxID=1399 RepID=UPI00204190C6|nr:type II toxin-antitoxin system PemK/MazF family toxin [Cytobacillus firmus]MCM3707362.1 type II toxin-antitoxin system PemK/MazF family toxin [Cytobacillus firmus]